MDIFLIYIIGVVIFTIGIYWCKIHDKEYIYFSKKQLAYQAFKIGLLSWLGIFITIMFKMISLMIYSLDYIDDWINKKLA